MCTKESRGLAIMAVKLAAYTDVTINEAARIQGVKRSSIICAAKRLDMQLMKCRANRRLMLNKGFYYFRVRHANLTALWKLSADIHQARDLRDKLESFFKLL
jgi:hypothetical protein